jgi:hypothetical protein
MSRTNEEHLREIAEDCLSGMTVAYKIVRAVVGGEKPETDDVESFYHYCQILMDDCGYNGASFKFFFKEMEEISFVDVDPLPGIGSYRTDVTE